MSLQQALADNDGAINETFDMSLDDNGDDWITASEDDGECDDIINDLRGEQSRCWYSVSGLFLSGS
jgi:hypothetical protein